MLKIADVESIHRLRLLCLQPLSVHPCTANVGGARTKHRARLSTEAIKEGAARMNHSAFCQVNFAHSELNAVRAGGIRHRAMAADCGGHNRYVAAVSVVVGVVHADVVEAKRGERLDSRAAQAQLKCSKPARLQQ